MPAGIATAGIIGGSSCGATEGIICVSGLLTIDLVEPQVLPDNGGIPVVISGFFVPDVPIVVTISDPVSGLQRDCYSGVPGQGAGALSVDGDLQVIAVPFPIGGPYDLILTPEGNPPTTAVGVITVVHRSFASNLFSVRSTCAPMRPRNVGPGDIHEED